MLIVTGASDNHYKSLRNLIQSVITNAPAVNILVYNLGIEQSRWNELLSAYQTPKVSFRIFDFSQIPSWIHIEQTSGRFERGAWAWKSRILKEVVEEGLDSILFWMDAGNLVNTNLEILEQYLQQEGLFSSISSGTIKKWTHPTTLDRLGRDFLGKECRNAACLGFCTRIPYVREFLDEWYTYCQDPDCIAPEGSSRQNHRQDQAVYSILYYKYKRNYKFDELLDPSLVWTQGYYIYGFTIHNDVD